MSRHGYSDDFDGWDLIRYRGAVTSAIRGKRGQTLLREMLAALDAMPEKRLIQHELELGGQVCALGCLGKARGLRMDLLDPEDPEQVARAFGVAESMIREIVFVNDEGAYYGHQSPEQRWANVRAWVVKQLSR